ncbi:MAG TPA: hypothetical protein VGO47_04495 [Chlamydiales bacterium]|nr:hypothetical protein [Chlamydiales bacterium]
MVAVSSPRAKAAEACPSPATPCKAHSPSMRVRPTTTTPISSFYSSSVTATPATPTTTDGSSSSRAVYPSVPEFTPLSTGVCVDVGDEESENTSLDQENAELDALMHSVSMEAGYPHGSLRYRKAHH